MTAFEVRGTENAATNRMRAVRLEINFIRTPAATIPITHRSARWAIRSRQKQALRAAPRFESLAPLKNTGLPDSRNGCLVHEKTRLLGENI